ncbi:unnamed protein product (macronuclear) [Paramecium tetraurelia]|uniref:Transmembrane protein n=1 Tax=Paramecium tetraurelia TaxID=5888 RepID=A0DSX9_PARTE|nr:uncharacterized protein GSPATT00019839001 [Paramecium tetraurelia]CAK86146.1 unnamed protein product [Paramecium tetraurelia]|eukprot:XP_001453543.1 hypothetical protein (macronuclear) [Paramecium tetraurelia strain d4-2]
MHLIKVYIFFQQCVIITNHNNNYKYKQTQQVLMLKVFRNCILFKYNLSRSFAFRFCVNLDLECCIYHSSSQGSFIGIKSRNYSHDTLYYLTNFPKIMPIEHFTQIICQKLAVQKQMTRLFVVLCPINSFYYSKLKLVRVFCNISTAISYQLYQNVFSTKDKQEDIKLLEISLIQYQHQRILKIGFNQNLQMLRQGLVQEMGLYNERSYFDQKIDFNQKDRQIQSDRTEKIQIYKQILSLQEGQYELQLLGYQC